MGNVTEEKWIEMLEKKADGNYIAKYPKVKTTSPVTCDEHLAESVTHKVSNRKPTATDDETQNIKQGDIWIYENYINEEEYEFIAYQCMDNKAGMAKWEKYVEKVVSHKIYGVEIDETIQILKQQLLYR